MASSTFLIKGLSEKHKEFLKFYAQKNLGSSSRTKAIIAIVDEMMKKDADNQDEKPAQHEIQKQAIDRKKLYIQQHQKLIKENNEKIFAAKQAKNYNLVKELSRKKFHVKKQRVQFSLPIYDYEFLHQLAEINQNSIQYYITTILCNHMYYDTKSKKLFGGEIEQLKKSNYELHKIGVNINQIAKANNIGDNRDLPINQLYNEIVKHITIVKNILNNSTGIY